MKHIKEKWKDIIGYEGYYKVSNLGNKQKTCGGYIWKKAI